MNKFKIFKTEQSQVITLIVLSLILSTIFFYSHGNISTDTGREAVIPLALLNGEIMYKDILNIYAPLSYYINSIFMTIFGIKLESLYFGGVITTLISTILLYKISQKSINRVTSFFLTLFVAVTCFYNSSLFNFIMPYSYAVTYAICFTFATTYYLLKFTEQKENKYIYYAAVLSGAAFACKVEYVGICLITLFVLLNQTKNFKTITGVSATICIIPFLSYLIPFLQGLTITEGLEAIKIFIKEATVPSMQSFSKNVGTIFTPTDVVIWIKGFVLFFVFVIISTLLFKKAKTPLSYLIALFVASIIHYITHGEIHFSSIAVLLTIYLLINFKKLLQDKPLLILLLTGILTSLKTFYNTDLSMYGVFTLPLLLIATIAIIEKNFSSFIEQKFKVNTKTLIVFLLMAATISNLTYALIKKDFYSYPIKTEKGRIDTTEVWQKEAVKLLNFIKNNTEKDDKILFLPEGAMFNFLSGRPTDMEMYVLDIPFIETLGEAKILNGLSQYKYIAIIDGFGLYDFDNSRYYFKTNNITHKINREYTVIYHEKTAETEVILLKKSAK